MAERAYMILEAAAVTDDGWAIWKPVATVDAHSTIDAVTTYAAGIEESRTLELVAVPLRSWKPVLLERRPEWTTRIAADDGGRHEPDEPADDGEPEPVDED